MFKVFFLIFIAVPIVEIAVLLQVGELIGGLNTLALIILTALVGAFMVKQQGLQNWLTMQRKMARGQMPGEEMASGLLIFLAGMLLITPGFVTDVVGLLLLAPPSRKAIARSLLKRMVIQGRSAHFTQYSSYHASRRHGQTSADNENGTTIEGEFQRSSDPSERIDEPEEHKKN